MSALGQKQTCATQKVMSALPSKADIRHCKQNVRYGTSQLDRTRRQYIDLTQCAQLRGVYLNSGARGGM